MTTPGYERLALLVRDLDGGTEILATMDPPKGPMRVLLAELQRSLVQCSAQLERLSGPPSAAEIERDALRGRLGNIERAARTAAERLLGLCPPSTPPFPSDSHDMGLAAQLWCIAMELGNEIEWAAEMCGEDGGES